MSHYRFVVAMFLSLAAFLYVQYFIVGESFLNAVAQFNNNTSRSRGMTVYPWFYHDHGFAHHHEPEPSMALVTNVNIEAGAGSQISAPAPTSTTLGGESHAEHFEVREFVTNTARIPLAQCPPGLSKKIHRGLLLEPMKQVLYNKRFSYQTSPEFYLPPNELQLSKLIRCMNRSNKKWRIRNGGLSYMGYGSIGTDVVIDLSRMNGIEVSGDKSHVLVGGGQLLGSTYMELAKAGVYIPGGTAPNVGVSGSTLAGGIGFASRLAGLTCDNVLSASVVTSDGQMFDHDEVDPNLLKAIRGGGPFYAVVGQWKFLARPIVSHPKLLWLQWREGLSTDEARSIIELYMKERPWRWANEFGMVEICFNGAELNLQIHYLGNESDTFYNAITPFTTAGTLYKPAEIVSANASLSWEEYIVHLTNTEHKESWSSEYLGFEKLFDQTRANKFGFSAASVYFDEQTVRDPAFAKLIVDTIMSEQNGEIGHHFQLRALGGAMAAESSDRLTSWGFRRAVLEVHVLGHSDDSGASEGFLARVMDVFKPRSLGHGYSHVHDSITSHEDYFPGQKDLPAVKQRFDEGNLIMRDTAGAPPPKP